MWYRFSHWITSYGAQMLGAVVTLVVGYFVARFTRQVVKRLLRRTQVPLVAQGFIGQVTYIGILVFAVVATLERFGVQTTSLVAVLGAASFAIGFAHSTAPIWCVNGRYFNSTWN